jgi:hypothetical protein
LQQQYSPPDLHHLEELQELIIEHNSPFPALLGVLSALHRSPGRSTLEAIELYAVNDDGLRCGLKDHWRSVDTILADAAVFPRLRRVTVRVRVRTLVHPDFPADYSVPNALATQLYQTMALSHNRGLLSAP